jgi:hypothetical protein
VKPFFLVLHRKRHLVQEMLLVLHRRHSGPVMGFVRMLLLVQGYDF